MKLGISNIAWNKDIDQNVYKMLYELGIKHLEIAPSRMNSEFNFYKPYSYENEISNINNFNLICESSQAILFGKDELSIFNQDCWDDFFLHLNSIIVKSQYQRIYYSHNFSFQNFQNWLIYLI